MLSFASAYYVFRVSGKIILKMANGVITTTRRAHAPSGFVYKATILPEVVRSRIEKQNIVLLEPSRALCFFTNRRKSAQSFCKTVVDANFEVAVWVLDCVGNKVCRELHLNSDTHRFKLSKGVDLS